MESAAKIEYAEEQEYGTLQFHTSIPGLEDGFLWAKGQALAYAHHGEDPAGLWYEAALPGREAFCMRDVAHHAGGAGALGLAAHTKNMLRRFAESISENRGWCGYWEITKDGLPCPVDYTDDQDFWYNFPGGFDVILACLQEYLRTGDEDYLKDPVFCNFYELTCTRFLELWDKDGDGLPEHYPEYGRRGIASYNEADTEILTAGDQLACQWAAFGAYASILDSRGEKEKAGHFRNKQAELKKMYQTGWRRPDGQGFYGAVLSDGSFYPGNYGTGNSLPIYYGILNGSPLLFEAYGQLRKCPLPNVEEMSYLPRISYICGDEKYGLEVLKALADPALPRREYPEVSYAYIGTLVDSVMGIRFREKEIVTKSGIPEGETAQLLMLPCRTGAISVRHEGKNRTVLENHTAETLNWKAIFPGESGKMYLDGEPVRFRTERDSAGRTVSFTTVEAAPEANQCIWSC